ncbi:tigger transposable element-derived protein 1-like [Anopheles funestus]|uniref:tigger transposable element-derived protein 1-like n=1 Tax=Anopheles funestus TaxID=62324 RepID=UPI0020C666DF|nr:tigger transposable element-derived protein 1-like [Anopheles funestus]XP_049296844.1 tigger transposable element-derived protein 1-like [Anopheles funestus]
MESNYKNSRKKCAITMSEKLEMIKLFEKGKSYAAIARQIKRPQSTVRTIIQRKDNLLNFAKGDSMATRKRNEIIEEMERLLVIWIEDLLNKRIPLSLQIIQTKAKSLYQDIESSTGITECTVNSFKASSGWFNRFKNRTNLKNMKMHGEAGSADEEAAENFPGLLEKIIVEKGFLPEQIINVDETALFWKKMPTKSYVFGNMIPIPGIKLNKERITIMVGSNMTGDLKLKPLAVYHSQKPRAFKHVQVQSLPVVWKSNKKAWVTRSIFNEWFLQNFVPEVEKYCRDKGIPFKILLLVDNAPGHPIELNELHPNVEVVFLPPRTTSLLQPMDQGVIATLKSYYLRRTFTRILHTIEQNPTFNITDAWKNYDILSAIRNISAAWHEVKSSTINECWKKICPAFFTHDTTSTDEDEQIQLLIEECVSAANVLPLEIDAEDIRQFIFLQEEPLTNNELIEADTLEVLDEYNEEYDEEDLEPIQKRFSSKRLEAAFENIEKALSEFQAMDEDEERSANVSDRVRKEIAVYKNIYNDKKVIKRQLSMDSFVQKL